MGKYSELLSDAPPTKAGKYAALLAEPVASAPAKAEKSFGQALVENVPFGPSVQDVTSGVNPYTATTQGVSRGFGDIGAGAGLLAGGMALGAAPVAAGVGIGALAGAGLEMSGVSPYLRDKAQGVRNKEEMPLPLGLPSVPQKNFPSKVLGIEGLGQALNLGQEGVKELTATPIDLAPAALTALLTATGLKGVGKARQAIQDAPTSAIGGAKLLQDAGVPITPAMEQFSKTGQRTGIPALLERVTNANPLTARSMEKLRNKAGAAVGEKIKSGIPNADVSPQVSGGLLSNVMENFQKRRGQAVGSAKDALRELDAGDVGKLASNRIIEQLEKGGVPFDETGFAPTRMTGRERMDAPTAQALVQVERDLRGATLGEAINYLENFDQKMGPSLQTTYGDKAANAVKTARSLIKQSITEAAGAADPALAKALTDADRAYSISQPTAKKFLQESRGNVPEVDLPSRLFGKAGAKGDKSLGRLQRTMTKEEFGQVQDTLAAEVLRASGGAEKLSLAKLKTSLKNLGDNAKYLKPEALKALEDSAMMMETAGVAEMGLPNSGTPQRFMEMATVGGIPATMAVYGNPAGVLGLGAGSAALRGYMAYPGLRNTLLKGAKRYIPSNVNVPAAQTAAAVSPAFVQALNQ